MKNCIYFIRGLGVGVVAGMGLAVAAKCLCTNNKEMCQRSKQAAKTMGEIMSDIKEMLC